MIKAIISENSINWVFNRALYSVKLKSLNLFPWTEKWYEKNTDYPSRVDIFDIDVSTLKSFICNSDKEKGEKLILAADNICEGTIHVFSSFDLAYGNPIDWQLNPLTEKRCSENVKWFKIPDFDINRGDIKVTWEASRFSHFITLSRAYLLTGDEKYYRAFSTQLREWLCKNAYSYGTNHKCGQECSLRMVNALLAFTVFKNCGLVTDVDVSNVKDLVDRCYRKILSNFFYAYKCIRNNHTVSELMGMIVGAWCCEDQKQLNRAYYLLDEVIDEQFEDDGGYCQFSFNYQRLVLQDLEVILSIEKKTGRSIKRQNKEKIKNSALLLYQCQDETGDVPNYGSNDGALIFPVTFCGYRDFRPVVNTIFSLIAGSQIYEDGIHQEELIWFANGKFLKDYDRRVVERCSSQFSDAGLFTLRDKKSWMMLVLNDYKRRPGHMDQLHLDLWLKGVNVFCDSGTFSYVSRECGKLASNWGHNTVVVDNVPQMNTRPPFLTYDWTKRELGECSAHCFEAKMISANGYEHIRKVVCKDGMYEIEDSVNRDFSVLFHTPCDVQIDGDRVILSYSGQKLCVVRSTGVIHIGEAQRSLHYLRKSPISCLTISGQAGDNIITSVEVFGGE